MKFINLTPHTVTLNASDFYPVHSFAPSGKVARVEMKFYETHCNLGLGISLRKSIAGDVIDLPDEVKDSETYYIVSAQVRLALPDRKDLVSPGDLIRDENGNVVGCKFFIIN